MSQIRKFASQTVVYGVGSILSRVVYYLVVTIWLANILGDKTDEFGTFAYFYAYATVLVTFFSFRLETALFRFGNKNEDLDTAFNTALTPVLFAAVALALLGTLFALPIATLIGFSEHPRYVKWFSYILAFDVVNLLPFAKLRLTNRAKAFALYKIVNVFISIVLILFFLLVLPIYSTSYLSFLPQLDSIVEWVFIANVIASALLFVSLYPTLRSFRLRIDKGLLTKMFWYAFPLVIVGMANAFVQFFAVPLQKAYLGTTDSIGEAGVYDFTRRIAALFVMFTTAFNYAAEPFFFNNSSEQDRNKLYGKICRLFVLVGGGAIISMYLGLDLLSFIIPKAFSGSLYLLPLMLIANLFIGIYYNVSIWYKLSDNTKYGAIISIIGAVITLSISVLFLPVVGVATSAWALLISYVTMVGLAYVWGQRLYPIVYPVFSIVKDLVLVTSMLGLVYLLREGGFGLWVRLLGGILVLGLYLVYVYSVERDQWRRIFKFEKTTA